MTTNLNNSMKGSFMLPKSSDLSFIEEGFTDEMKKPLLSNGVALAGLGALGAGIAGHELGGLTGEHEVQAAQEDIPQIQDKINQQQELIKKLNQVQQELPNKEDPFTYANTTINAQKLKSLLDQINNISTNDPVLSDPNISTEDAQDRAEELKRIQDHLKSEFKKQLEMAKMQGNIPQDLEQEIQKSGVLQASDENPIKEFWRNHYNVNLDTNDNRLEPIRDEVQRVGTYSSAFNPNTVLVPKDEQAKMAEELLKKSQEQAQEQLNNTQQELKNNTEIIQNKNNVISRDALIGAGLGAVAGGAGAYALKKKVLEPKYPEVFDQRPVISPEEKEVNMIKSGGNEIHNDYLRNQENSPENPVKQYQPDNNVDVYQQDVPVVQKENDHSNIPGGNSPLKPVAFDRSQIVSTLNQAVNSPKATTTYKQAASNPTSLFNIRDPYARA